MGFPAGSVQVTSNIGTTSSSDTYPTHLDYLGYGGSRTVTTLAALSAVTTARRAFGMKVEVIADSNINNNGTYILANATNGGVDNDLSNNNNWIFYNGNYGQPGTSAINFSFVFTRVGILEILYLLSTVDMSLLIGITPGGSEIAIIALVNAVAQTVRMDYPVDNSTTVYVTGVTGSGGSVSYKKWVKL